MWERHRQFASNARSMVHASGAEAVAVVVRVTGTIPVVRAGLVDLFSQD